MSSRPNARAWTVAYRGKLSPKETIRTHSKNLSPVSPNNLEIRLHGEGLRDTSECRSDVERNRFTFDLCEGKRTCSCTLGETLSAFSQLLRLHIGKRKENRMTIELVSF